MAEWIRGLMVAHAGEVLQVEVMRAGLRHAPRRCADLETMAARPGGPPSRGVPPQRSALTSHRAWLGRKSSMWVALTAAVSSCSTGRRCQKFQLETREN
jgi:hypothetical protein